MTLDSAQVRYGKELDRPFVTVSVVTAEGTPLEARVPTGPPPPPSPNHTVTHMHTPFTLQASLRRLIQLRTPVRISDLILLSNDTLHPDIEHLILLVRGRVHRRV